ncbi:fibronectin type III domain-containing protein [[Muricauda] lutisoli]|uniref:Fibronectin type-III domain-containing protein n=1 Tax=[Muricauda] lutisoli TaxID=2816035 RepID=A0ABS3EUS0_9FLAO|nr:fibronectin type III domain-containing protein [[Muricauda] lutisoli]MBO0329990.1 hypothetical protein [[Muricauda] lutisoli]
MKYPILSLALIFLLGCSSSSESENEPQSTVDLPIIATNSPNEITAVSAQLGGSISNNGGANIIDKGVVWDVASGPTINDNKKSIGSGNDNFSAIVDNLEPDTKYYARSYAVNSKGTAYGNEVTFTTLIQEPQSKVYEGTIDLSNQSLVDSFGAENYTEVTGEVRIYGSVNDLTPLSNLELIGQDLLISNADNLVSLNGLENVLEIGESIQFINNDALTDISALESLNASYAIIFQGNDALKTISGFSQTVNVSGLVKISENTNLEVISGFQNLETTGNYFQITDNASLVDLNGLSKLTSIGNGLWLNNNDALTDLTPLSSLESISEIVINGNASLEAITIFNPFTSLTSIEISNNGSLTSIQGFESLTNVDGGIRINSNVLLTSITAFGNITSFGTDVQIRYNQVLQDFCILNSLITAEYTGSFSTIGNAYNPTLQDMIDGNCKL